MKYVLSLVMVFCLIFPASEASPIPKLTPVQSWEAFAGTWQLVGAVSVAEDQIKTAVSMATEKMNFLTRGIARDRLISTLKVPKLIRMRRENNMFIIHPDTFIALGMPISGETVKHEDRMFRVSLDSGSGRPAVRQVAENKDGKRENVYRLQDNGKSLDLEVTVSSSQLPAQVQYKLQYALGE